MAKICYFLSINKDWLNPFKCSETIGNYEGRWYRWYMTLGWTTDYRGWPTDYGRWMTYVVRWPKLVVSFNLIRTVWIHLNVLKWSLYLWFPSFHNIQMDSEWPCLFWRLRFWSSSDMPWSSSVVCRPLEDDLQSKEDDLDIRGAENIHWEKSRLMTSRTKRINSYNWILVPYIHNNCSNRGLDASVAVTVSQQ